MASEVCGDAPSKTNPMVVAPPGEVDRTVPLPTPRYRAQPVTPKAYGELSRPLRALATANIGDSVLLLGARFTSVNGIISRFGGRAWAAMRVVEGGIRVWKIAEPRAAQP